MKFRFLLTKSHWLAAFAGIALSIASTAEAAPVRTESAALALGRPDIVKVDHRHGWRPHRRHWRGSRRHYYRGHIHGRGYRGHAAAYDWLAFTAITVKLLDVISDSQRRAYESASVRATTAPVGETIHWNRQGARGTITTVRDGTSSTGRYCREFQQTATVGGRTESAYGTACRQPDGSWEIMP